MTIEHLFFELIRVAIGTQDRLSRPPSGEEWKLLYDMAKKQSLVGVCFSAVQRLSSIEDSMDSTGSPQVPHKPYTINLPEVLYLTWMGMAAKIQQRNEVVNRQCVELQAKLSADGIRSSILKGQGVASLYSEHLRGLRQSGDIDIYVDCGREKAIEYARTLQDQVDWDYKHLHLNVFPDPSTGSGQAAEVEVHYVPEVMSNLWTNRKLRKWFAANAEGLWFRGLSVGSNLGESVTASGCRAEGLGITAPSVEFNLVYILLHAYRHFLYEGVGLRQLMDYYFVLLSVSQENKKGFAKKAVLTKTEKKASVSAESQIESLANDCSAEIVSELPSSANQSSATLSGTTDKSAKNIKNIANQIDKLGMMRFAKGVMWIIQNVFANDGSTSLTTSNDDLFLGIKPDEKEGRYILNEVMRGGNFGHHDERLKSEGKGNWKVEDVKRRLRHSWHLFRHYPGEVIWSPVYIVWHKAWVILHRR